MNTVELNLTYTNAQNKVFWLSKARRRIIRKGRRVGFTRGCAQYVIETMLDGTYSKVLWGDTIHQNIRNYVERYFMPVLRQLPSTLWSWRVTDKILTINGAVCDFRAAESPENWEGFGYDLVILNEAGIILKNRYLWENAVSPMLLDNPKSVCIIGGTPKGKGLFHELFQQSGEDWEAFAFSTYDNPYLDKDAIDSLAEELGGSESAVRQEIHGEFIDNAANELFAYDALVKSMQPCERTDTLAAEVWGVDVARHGGDMSCIAKRRGGRIYALTRLEIPDLMMLADRIAGEYTNAVRKPDAIFVEVTGIGWGLYDRLTKLGVPAIPVDVGKNATLPIYFNKRAEMYKVFANTLSDRGMALPDDKRLLMELAAVEYEIREDGVFKLLPKDIIKTKLGYSPDSADACALTFAMTVYKKEETYETSRENYYGGVAW